MSSNRELEFVIKFRNEARSAIRNVSSDLAKLNQATAQMAKQQAVGAKSAATQTSALQQANKARARAVASNKLLTQQLTASNKKHAEAVKQTKAEVTALKAYSKAKAEAASASKAYNQQSTVSAKQQVGGVRSINAQAVALGKTSNARVVAAKSSKQLSDQNKKLIESFRGTAQQASLVLGPLSGVASRLTNLTQILSTGGAKLALFSVGLAALSLGFIKLIALSNQYVEMTNKLTVALGGSSGVNAAMDRLLDISNRTRSALASNIQLYQRASLAAKELGASQEQLYTFTEAIGNAIAIQGGAASAASGALLQLSQALGSGVVRAEEFNSILEGAFPIAQAAADGIAEAGGSIAKLRKLMLDGKVTSDAFFKAILSQSDELKDTFGKTTATVTQSLTVLSQTFTVFVGRLDASVGISATIASALLGLADVAKLLERNVEGVALVVEALALVGISRLLIPAVTALKRLLVPLAAKTLPLLTAAFVSLNKTITLTSLTSIPAMLAGFRSFATLAASSILPALAKLRVAVMAVFGGGVGLAIGAVILAYTKYRDTVYDATSAEASYSEVIKNLKRVRGELTSTTDIAATAEAAYILEHRKSTQATIDAADAELQLIEARLRREAMEERLSPSVNFFGKSDEERDAFYRDQIAKVKELRAEIAKNQAQINNPPVNPATIKQVAAEYREVSDALDLQIKNQKRMNEALGVSEERANAVADAIRVESKYREEVKKLQKDNVTLSYDDGVALKARIEQVVKLERAEDNLRGSREESLKTLKKQNKLITDAVSEVGREILLLKIPPELRESEAKILELRNALLKEGVLLGEEEETLLRAKYRELEKLERLDQLQKQRLEEIKTLYLEIGDTIKDDLVDAIEVFVGSGDSSFSDMLKRWKAGFIRVLAEMAVQAAINPIIVSTIQGSALGGTAQGQSAVDSLGGVNGIGDLLGGGNGFNITDVFKLNDVFSLAADSVLPSGVASVFDTIGNSVFGIGTTAAQAGATTLASGVAGPIAPAGTIFNGASGAFNPAGVAGGFAGNLLADAVFGGDRGIGATIGGGLGGVAGGLAISGALTAALGAIGGPLGIAIGAFAGNALGGLFGGKPSDKSQFGIAGFDGGIASQGGQEGKKFSQENRDAATQFAQVSGSLAGALTSIQGTIADFTRVRVQVGSRDGSTVTLLDAENNFITEMVRTASDGVSIIEGVVGTLLANIDGIPQYLLDAFENVDFTAGFEQAIQDINFIAGFEELLDPKIIDTLTEAQQGVNQINDVFEGYIDTAERLGFTIEKLTLLEDRRREVLQALTDDFNQAISSQITGILNPALGQIDALIQQYNLNLGNATTVGGDTTQVDQLFKLQLAQLAEQLGYFSDATAINDGVTLVTNLEEAIDKAGELAQEFARAFESISAAIDALYMDEALSPLTLQQRLTESRSSFESLRSAGMNGDTDALNALPDAARELLELSREFNASSGTYTTDFENITKSLEDARDYAEANGIAQLEAMTVAQQSLAVAQDQLSILRGVDEGLADNAIALDAMTKTILDYFLNANSGVTAQQASAAISGAGITAQAPEFDESFYLANNPDIQAALNNGAIASAYSHYQQYGASEGRFANGDSFNSASYLANNPDVAAAVAASGGTLTAVAHYQVYGKDEGRTGFARGTGTAKRTPIGRDYMVGEAGVEIFRGSQSGQVFNNSETTQLSANSAVVGAMQRLEHKYDTTIELLASIAESSQHTATKDDGAEQLRRIAANTEKSNSVWSS